MKTRGLVALVVKSIVSFVNFREVAEKDTSFDMPALTHAASRMPSEMVPETSTTEEATAPETAPTGWMAPRSGRPTVGTYEEGLPVITGSPSSYACEYATS
ncbi:hypothetical protein [Streptomyces sp. GQFP]|uniref:hypothetical protein n=1 Tax=Streptomyces sp. GQFP TaxID=2907545 RepID=UPI001F2B20F4|nr:hypothetical protein [Streptomyces sp. GQFP]UIX31073.1 hypothetical protein LUX31_14100 [Streptomyces sp. GQFP]